MEHYCTGMKPSATLDPNLAKHPDAGIPLSAADKRALVAFLRTLTMIVFFHRKRCRMLPDVDFAGLFHLHIPLRCLRVEWRHDK